MFKDALQANSSTTTTNQINPCTFSNNLNIIRDPVVVRTKRPRQVGLCTHGNEVEAPLGIGQRPRLCSICNGVGHDARNCLDCDRLRRGRVDNSSSHNTIDHLQYLTQESFQSLN